MPDRIIRGKILSSETLASLSHPAERLFYRLLVLADDFGRFHASPRYVRSAAMGMLQVTVPNVAAWMKELERADVICLYEVDGRPYLAFKSWPRHQSLRAKTSKFPAHEGCVCDHTSARAGKREQTPTDSPGIGIGIGIGDGSEKKRKDPPAPPSGSTPSADGLVWQAAEKLIGDDASSFLGKLAAEHGKPALLRAIGALVAVNPAPENPRGYLTAVIRRNGGSHEQRPLRGGAPGRERKASPEASEARDGWRDEDERDRARG